jgi:hypothetical protein
VKNLVMLRHGLFFCSSGNSGENGDEISPFISLLAQRNEPKKGHPGTCPAGGGIPGVYAPLGVLLDAAGALQTRYAQTVQIPFSAASPVLGCVPMGIFFSPPPFVLPRLADGGGKRR